jgi:hypothetical protein
MRVADSSPARKLRQTDDFLARVMPEQHSSTCDNGHGANYERQECRNFSKPGRHILLH